MDMVNAILQIVEVLVAGVVILAFLLVGLLVAISFMPKENPLRQVLAALTMPVGTMLAVGALGIPIEAIPGIDALYDLAGVVLIAFTWFKFARQIPVLWPRVVNHFATHGDSHFGSRDDTGAATLSAVECLRRAQAALERKAYPEAVRWFRLAAQRGNAAAKKFLDDLAATEQGRKQKEQSRGQGDGGRMTRAHALEILELAEGATREAISAAYLRLMQKVHPDKGGSTYFARQLNEAREVLLG
jgi:hypothetical protein